MVSESEIIDVFGFFARVRLQNGPTPDEVAATVAAWEVVFDDVSAQEFQKAARDWAKTSKWWPAPADIRGLIPSLKLAAISLEAADPLTGRDRWPAVLQAAGSLGRSCADWPAKLAARIGVDDADRLKRAVDDCGGWQAICNANHDAQRASMGKRFASSWDRQARAAAQGAPQIGCELRGAITGGVVDLRAELARRKALGGV